MVCFVLNSGSVGVQESITDTDVGCKSCNKILFEQIYICVKIHIPDWK